VGEPLEAEGCNSLVRVTHGRPQRAGVLELVTSDRAGAVWLKRPRALLAEARYVQAISMRSVLMLVYSRDPVSPGRTLIV
jgi:hypothetical protein